MKTKKVRCQVCGHRVDEVERVNGGLRRCYSCGKRAREAGEKKYPVTKGMKQ